MFGSLGMGELLVILVIVLVLFGANRIPQLMGGLGEGLKSFKKAIKDDEKDHQASVSEKDKEKDKVVR